jgi:hypothetical protein
MYVRKCICIKFKIEIINVYENSRIKKLNFFTFCKKFLMFN